jgi:hypothetical protein
VKDVKENAMTNHPMTSNSVPAAGVDSSYRQRPGVPMENEPPRRAGAAHWDQPERQYDPGHVLKRRGLPELTPVFGTSVPPRGLSGLMRRGAYSIAEHRVGHWFLLLAADRVDVIEDRLRRAAPILLPLALGGGLVAYAIGRRRTRGGRWWRMLRG